MTDILSQIGTKLGTQLKNLDTRLSSAENEIVALGAQTPPPTNDLTVAAVQWTNLTEITVGSDTVTSGGTVQANGNGGIEKISGSNGYNAGASSTNFIEGNSNGYVQFQIAQSPVRIGFTYADVDFENVNPFELVLESNGSATVESVEALPSGSIETGDFLRIRHYAQDNSVRFQKRQSIYQVTSTTFAIGELRRVTVPWTNIGITVSFNDILEVVELKTNGSYRYKTEDDNFLFSNASQFSVNTEQVEKIGLDYVTFYTHPDTSNGNNLFVDSSFFSVGSRLNDVLLAR